MGADQNWREGLPLLLTTRVVLRELRGADAAPLVALTRSPDVARHAPPAPATVDAFEEFIREAWRLRGDGKTACFAVVPADRVEPAGMFELRSLQPGFFRAELTLRLEPAVWDSGAFDDGVRLVCEFAFSTVGVHRVEIRSAIADRRAGAALARVGAQREAVLRGAFQHRGTFEDQYLWSIVKGLDRLAPAS